MRQYSGIPLNRYIINKHLELFQVNIDVDNLKAKFFSNLTHVLLGKQVKLFPNIPVLIKKNTFDIIVYKPPKTTLTMSYKFYVNINQ